MLSRCGTPPAEQVLFISSIPQKKTYSTTRVNLALFVSFSFFHNEEKKKKQSLSQSRQVPTKTFLALKCDSMANSQQPSIKACVFFFLSLSLCIFWKRRKAGGGQHRPGGQQCLDLWRYAMLKRCSVRSNALIYIWHWTGHTPQMASSLQWRNLASHDAKRW
jgi:hypothetical protein